VLLFRFLFFRRWTHCVFHFWCILRWQLKHWHTGLATAGFDVTVIDRNAVYYHRVGALRAIVDKSFDPYIPLDKIDGKFIHGSVVSIDEAKKVVIVQEKGCAVSTSHSYDYLILSPGSTHSGAGMQMTGESQAEHQSLLANIREELHQVRKAGTSKQVLIVGGGGPSASKWPASS
jgi:NADH dehydrogenase FAD-containing subunit